MWRHGAQRSNQDAQGTGIGKAANSKGGNSSTASLELSMYFRIVSSDCNSSFNTYCNCSTIDVLSQTFIGNKLVDYGLGGHHLGNYIAVFLRNTHCPHERDKQLGEYPFEVDVIDPHQIPQPANQPIEEGNERHKGHNVGDDAQDDGHRIACSTGGSIQYR